MEIITNNVPRLLKYGYEVPEKFRADFDYLDDINDGTFFEYRGQWYDLGEFTRCEHSFGMEGWHGYYGDSAWSGVLIKLSDDGEAVTVGRYYS